MFGFPEQIIKGELALVTGGGGGLGRLLALRLSKLGVDIVIWDINQEGEFILFNRKYNPIVYKIQNENTIAIAVLAHCSFTKQIIIINGIEWIEIEIHGTFCEKLFLPAKNGRDKNNTDDGQYNRVHCCAVQKNHYYEEPLTLLFIIDKLNEKTIVIKMNQRR